MADSKQGLPIESQPADATEPADAPDRTPDANDRTRRAIGLSNLGMLTLVLALIGLDVAVVNGARDPPPRPIITRQVVKVADAASGPVNGVLVSLPRDRPRPPQQAPRPLQRPRCKCTRRPAGEAGDGQRRRHFPAASPRRQLV